MIFFSDGIQVTVNRKHSAEGVYSSMMLRVITLRNLKVLNPFFPYIFSPNIPFSSPLETSESLFSEESKENIGNKRVEKESLF